MRHGDPLVAIQQMKVPDKELCMYLAVDFQDGIESAWSNVATFVPKLATALLILLVGWFVAKAVASILNKVLERVGFDRVVERGGVRQLLARSKYDPSDILAKLVFWTILLFVLQLAFGVFGSNPISDLLRGLIARGAGIAILVFAAFAALDQLQIATRIVTGLWYAILAAWWARPPAAAEARPPEAGRPGWRRRPPPRCRRWPGRDGCGSRRAAPPGA
jgi:hypothetical protein